MSNTIITLIINEDRRVITLTGDLLGDLDDNIENKRFG